MKKIFFAALVAVAAIGGAVSSNAQDLRGVISGYLYNCSNGTTYLCSGITEPVVLESDHSQYYNVANFTTQKYD